MLFGFALPRLSKDISLASFGHWALPKGQRKDAFDVSKFHLTIKNYSDDRDFTLREGRHFS